MPGWAWWFFGCWTLLSLLLGSAVGRGIASGHPTPPDRHDNEETRR